MTPPCTDTERFANYRSLSAPSSGYRNAYRTPEGRTWLGDTCDEARSAWNIAQMRAKGQSRPVYRVKIIQKVRA